MSDTTNDQKLPPIQSLDDIRKPYAEAMGKAELISAVEGPPLSREQASDAISLGIASASAFKASTAPLLSDEEIDNRSRIDYVGGGIGPYWRPKTVRDFYEAKIASGELMVRKTVRWEFGSGASATCECGYIALKEHDGNSNFCPCCGSNVIEG